MNEKIYDDFINCDYTKEIEEVLDTVIQIINFRRSVMAEDESRRTNMAAYCLLIGDDKGHAFVKQVFEHLNGYLKEFFDGTERFWKKHVKEEMVQAVRILLEVCMNNTKHEENKDILLEFGFEKIFKSLCEDLIEGSVRGWSEKFPT